MSGISRLADAPDPGRRRQAPVPPAGIIAKGPEVANVPIELLSITETADHLGLHPKTVERMIRRGELPAIRIGDRKGIRVRVDDLQTFIDARTDPAGRS